MWVAVHLNSALHVACEQKSSLAGVPWLQTCQGGCLHCPIFPFLRNCCPAQNKGLLAYGTGVSAGNWLWLVWYICSRHGASQNNSINCQGSRLFLLNLYQISVVTVQSTKDRFFVPQRVKICAVARGGRMQLVFELIEHSFPAPGTSQHSCIQKTCHSSI